MTIEVKKHGILEQDSNDIHLENIKRLGYTVFRQLIPSETVRNLKKLLRSCYDMQVSEVGGEENLKKIDDEGIVRCLFSYDKIFIDEVLLQSVICRYLEILLDGPFTLYSQVGVFSKPGSVLYQTAWHREIQYQHFTSSRPMAIQSLFVLDPFNEETGGTYFLPVSHLFESFPSDEFVKCHEVQPELAPGDVVLMNSMTYHRSGINTSNDDRVLITNTYTRPVFASQFGFTNMIDPNTLSEKAKEVLGFRWNYNKTLLEWRMDRINSV